MLVDNDPIYHSLIQIYFKWKRQIHSSIRQPLRTINSKGRNSTCVKRTLAEIKTHHISIDINDMLCSFKQLPKQREVCLKKLLSILKNIRINSWEKILKSQQIIENKKRIKVVRTMSQFCYWNIIVLSQFLLNSQTTQMIATQALKFIDSMSDETSLMIIYKMLTIMESSNRLSICFSLIATQNRLLIRLKQSTKEGQSYIFLNQILFIRVLLKLGMIQDSKIMYMMKFNQNVEQNTDEQQIHQINGTPISIYQELLHAEIQYHSNNYSNSLKILADLTTKIEKAVGDQQLVKNIINHNIGLVLANYGHNSSSLLLLRRALNYLYCSKEVQIHNQKNSFISHCKQNMLLSILNTPYFPYKSMHDFFNSLPTSYSYKINYRKAQFCLNLYHEMLQSSAKETTYNKIHDFYETVYYYPNQPYFQQKNKDKNPNFSNNKYFYRRYVLSEKDLLLKSQQILQFGESYLKYALTILEKQRNMVINLEGEYKNLTQQVNLKLYNEYVDFKSSIYSHLCYINLCRRKWMSVIYFTKEYQSFEKTYLIQNKSTHQQQIYYNILSYKMQALCQLNRIDKSYDAMHELIGNVHSSSQSNLSTINTGYQQSGPAYFQFMNQQNNFYYNLSVLYCRQNKIAEAFQSIQKLLSQMKLSPANPKTNLPFSIIELLIHYNLRTNNNKSALQLIKYHRITNHTGGLDHYQPTLTITK